MTSKGLGKGGAKRHRKVLSDNIQGMTKPTIRVYLSAVMEYLSAEILELVVNSTYILYI